MGGGWGKSPKKIHARENAKKKNSCKEEGKEKKIHAEGRSNCDFYLIIIYLPVPIKNNSHSKYSWGLTPAGPCYIIINK